MGRLWKLALGVVIVAAIAIWDIGLPGKHAPAASTAAQSSPSPSVSSPSASASTGPIAPDVPGVLHPTGSPEFTAAFTGSSLDTSVWDTCYPEPQFRFGNGCTNFGNAGKEDEWYVPSQVKVSGGVLQLVADREPTPGDTSTGAPETYSCRSGMVTTYSGFRFKYGFIQVVARIPSNSGLWPALWLAAANLQWPPEMDMLEAWGGPQFGPGHIYASTYFHYATPTRNKQDRGVITPATLASGWHTFGLSWTRTQMTWLLDGKPVLTVRQYIPDQKMYFIANLAEYINKAQPDVTAGECSGSLDIRSVQVWKA
jgi:beta-glucanase (GH16 family)